MRTPVVLSRSASAAMPAFVFTLGCAATALAGGLESAGSPYLVAPIRDRLIAPDNTFDPAVSADGRWVVFYSRTASLVPGDSNGLDDVFLLDRATGQYTRISVGLAGAEPNGASVAPAISTDGRVIAFHSTADNLVPGDLNGRTDIFVLERPGGPLERVSVSSGGTPGNANSFKPALSADGRFVTFASDADNLVGDDLNGVTDVFVRDRQRGETFRVSLASDGTEGDAVSLLPSISANGRYVAFHSEATNFSDNEFDVLADIFLHDRVSGRTELVNVSSTGVRSNSDSAAAIVSADGRAVVFYSRATTLEPGLENLNFDIFVRDTLTARTELVSPGQDGEPSNGSSFNPVLSADGRRVAFQSEADNLAPRDGNGNSDVYLFDRQTGSMSLVSSSVDGVAAAAGSFSPALTGDGAEALFESSAGDLDGLGGGTVALFANRPGRAGALRLTLAADLGVPPNTAVDAVRISGDGKIAAFATAASNLVGSDLNASRDVFVFDRRAASVELISGMPGGVPVSPAAAGDSGVGALSADGCLVAFVSAADGEALGNAPLIDDNAAADVYLRDRCARGSLRVLSVALDGIHHGDGASTEVDLSGDGALAAFTSLATDLTVAGNAAGVTQVYLVEVATGALTLISAAGGAPGAFASDTPAVAAAGGHVAFVGRDPALDPTVPLAERPAPGDAAVYRYDVASGQIELISRGLGAGGVLATPLGESRRPAISADGKVIAFTGNATNLTAAGSTGIDQVYAWREDGVEPNRIVAVEPALGAPNGASANPVVSADGRFVVFESDASNFVAGDDNGQTDVIAVDLRDGGATLVSRADDGSAPIGGPSDRPAVGGTGTDLLVGYLSSGAVVGGNAVDGGLYLQPLMVLTPELTIDGFVDSPLQSVESGALRLQVRNTGNVPLSAAEGIALEFPVLGHLLAVGDPPRWQCMPGSVLRCDFVGDVLLGDAIPPTAAERLDFDFAMFAGTDAIVSEVRLRAGFLTAGAEPVLRLTTERVQRGVVWEAAASQELGNGETGTLTVNVTNGGLEPVSSIRLEIRALVIGEPPHPRGELAGTNWQCDDAPPVPPTPVAWGCDYVGPALPPGSVTELSMSFELPGGAGQLASVAELSADVDVISPDEFEVLVTTAADRVFGDGFEG